VDKAKKPRAVGLGLDDKRSGAMSFFGGGAWPSNKESSNKNGESNDLSAHRLPGPTHAKGAQTQPDGLSDPMAESVPTIGNLGVIAEKLAEKALAARSEIRMLGERGVSKEDLDRLAAFAEIAARKVAELEEEIEAVRKKAGLASKSGLAVDVEEKMLEVDLRLKEHESKMKTMERAAEARSLAMKEAKLAPAVSRLRIMKM
jgi:hypothetical protein